MTSSIELPANASPYPGRRLTRTILKTLIGVALNTLGKVEVIGRENLPSGGPLLVVGNHFSFLDPVAFIHVLPWQLEFLGGVQTPNAPPAVGWIRNLWRTMPVRRGSASRDTLLLAQSLLEKGGVLGIFPEGGSWAKTLRPARPGAALLAARSGAPILPVGLDGFTTFFANIRAGRHGKGVVRFGKPFVLPSPETGSRVSRHDIDEAGHTIMRQISLLIPEEQRGFYSTDSAIRKSAEGSEIYPWDNIRE